MGVVINPRGTSGSGKTELVRRVLAQYGWRRGAAANGPAGLEPIYRPGRSRPFGYRLPHPGVGRPLVVVGHYEVTSGGCDTIPAADGGLHEAVAQAGYHASSGCDVIIEGLLLSSETELCATLARAHRLHIVCLATPVEQCARHLVARRRVRRDGWPQIAARVESEHRLVVQACDELRSLAAVDVLGFEDAVIRVGSLLGVGAQAKAEAPGDLEGDRDGCPGIPAGHGSGSPK
jgi:hypothetical protein